MSKVRLYGDTSGFVDLKAPDVAGDVTITLPNTTGPFATETYVDSEIAAIPEIAGIGTNVVQTVMTSTFSTTSATFVDITGLSATITPTSATSKILVFMSISVTGNTTNSDRAADFTILRGSTNLSANNAFGAIGLSPEIVSSVQNFNNAMWSGVGMFLDSPGTTSATTYKGQINNISGGSNTVYVNRRTGSATPTGISTITVIEVAA